MSLLDRLVAPGPKRLLALDGGGIRGMLSLGFLAEIETILRERHDRTDLVLADYFDLIGGTSTGAIIAAGLALGMSVEELRLLYSEAGGKAFGKKLALLGRLRASYDAEPLEAILKERLGDVTLGDERLRTGLCIIAKRADTNSTWPMHNHPRGRYFDANRRIPLWRAVRASTAAPTYFVPELMQIPDRVGALHDVAFVDGGVSMCVNPALQLFMLATMQSCAFNWPTGPDDLLLVSVGTGTWQTTTVPKEVASGKLWNWAQMVPGMLMDDSSWQAQLLLQWWSASPTPWLIDREIGDLRGDILGGQPLLSYLRYDVRLEPDCLTRLGEPKLAKQAAALRQMDNAALRDALDRIGRQAATKTLLDEHGREIQYAVLPSHFGAGFDRSAAEASLVA